MSAGNKLLLVESVIPPGNDPFMGKFLDLTMMLIPGGKPLPSLDTLTHSKSAAEQGATASSKMIWKAWQYRMSTFTTES